ncbi:Hypothetical predicted protein [Paramuricea clavata]|uniref:Uncharacterized protein n=1 Tax=Paramuricea clavata TaxID=317549 RepID=A0A6S7GYK3_PARCT|nr:Hypothetical predicted protein [Paramuricea clavata]
MTSSNHPDHIIANVFVRVQAEKEFKASQPTTSDTQQAHVSKLASSLPDFGNTVIPKQMLQVKEFGGERVRMETLSFLMQREIMKQFLKRTNLAPLSLQQLQERGGLLEKLLANMFGEKSTIANQSASD